jgi:hypothetical protein
MNEQDNVTPSGDTPPAEQETPPPTVAPSIEDGWQYNAQGFQRYYSGNVVQTMSERQFADYTTALQESERKLKFEQIDGSDSRLTDFWEKAQELADNANHCEVFDTIAEALGGPSRVKEWSVTVTMMVQVPVSYQMDTEAKSAEEAEEWATDYVRSMNATDLEDSADWWSAEIDTYSMEAEAEEA